MKNMTLSNIAAACGGKLCNFHGDEREVLGVDLDSRRMEKGYLYLAAAGERVDGHQFIPAVIAQGAAGVICEKIPEQSGFPYILVENSMAALQDIAEFYRRQLNIKVVGITGSVGKTSTKEFVAQVLSEHYDVLKTEGNFNNEIGLPLTILKIREQHEIAVVEMGISDFGEMHRLSRMAKPDVCLITNIGQCHLENLKNREGILKAKSEIFDFMAEDGVVFLNGEDDLLADLNEVKGKSTIHFGLKEGSPFYAKRWENMGLLGSRAQISAGEELLDVTIPLPGDHMVLNAVAAVAVGSFFGLSKEEICRGIEHTLAVSGRGHLIKAGRGLIIDDCYNANPASMSAALDLLGTVEGRKTAILGDMFELGEEETELHSQIGRYSVKKNLDTLVCIGSLSRCIYESAEEELEKSSGNCEKERKLFYFETREAFLKQIDQVIHKDDTVLLKASHGMGFTTMILPIRDYLSE